MDERLRRNAADVEAGSTEPVRFLQHGTAAALSGADRRDMAARPAADGVVGRQVTRVSPP
jgi:hypothetical protein